MESVPDPAEEETLFPPEEEPSYSATEAGEQHEAEKRVETRKSRRKATEAPPEPQAVEEPVDTAPEAEDATEDPAEVTEAKPKSKRRPKLNIVTPATGNVKMFTPDFSKLQPLTQQHAYLRVVLYGDGGAGKTTSLATLANRGTLIVVDSENSVRKKALARRGVNVDNILMWPDWTYDGMEQLYVTAKAKLEEEPGSIFAIGIDTVTSLVSFWLEDDVEAAIRRPDMQRKHPNRTQFDVFQDDYGTMTQQVQALITRKLYQLPCHIVVTAHARRSENEDGLVRVGPALSPAASQSLFTYSDWVLRLTLSEKNGKTKRGLDTAPRGNIEAKERFGVLEDRMSYHSLEELFEIWEEADSDG